MPIEPDRKRRRGLRGSADDRLDRKTGLGVGRAVVEKIEADHAPVASFIKTTSSVVSSHTASLEGSSSQTVSVCLPIQGFGYNAIDPGRVILLLRIDERLTARLGRE